MTTRGLLCFLLQLCCRLLSLGRWKIIRKLLRGFLFQLLSFLIGKTLRLNWIFFQVSFLPFFILLWFSGIPTSSSGFTSLNPKTHPISTLNFQTLVWKSNLFYDYNIINTPIKLIKLIVARKTHRTKLPKNILFPSKSEKGIKLYVA